MPDPFDVVSALGVRIVFVPDFDYRITLVSDVGVLLVDPAVDRQVAADSALDLILDPSCTGRTD